MTTSPPIRRISTSSLSKGLFVVPDKVVRIVKVLDIIPLIPFRAIRGPANEIPNRAVPTFFHCLFVKQMVYFEGFGDVGITVDKNAGGNVRTWVMEGIIGWGWRWLQLCHQEYRMYSPIIWHIQLVCKSNYLFKHTEWADILLDEFFCNPDGGQDGISLM